jgi:cell division cycle 14
MPEITDDDVFRSFEIIPGRLIFTPLPNPPHSTDSQYCFTIDDEPWFAYQPLDREFGPPTIVQIHNFYCLTAGVLNSHSELVQFWCTDNAYRFTTAVCYICTFRMVYSHDTVCQVFEQFTKLTPCFMPFNDFSPLPPTHLLSVEGYLKGFYRGFRQNWYCPEKFDAIDYAHYSEGKNGNMNWIVPGKLLALASPYLRRQLPDGYEVALPSDLLAPFKEKGITHIVRLNEKLYDAREFTRAGFRHTELFFDDGTCPPDRIRDAFLRIMNGKDVVALHCRAGVGRTYF